MRKVHVAPLGGEGVWSVSWNFRKIIRILGNFGKLTQGFKKGGGAVAKCVSGPQGRSPENVWYFSMCVDHFVRATVIQYKFLPLFLIFCTLSLVTVVVHEIDICNKFHLEKHNRKRAHTIRVFSKYYDVPVIAKSLNDQSSKRFGS